MKNYSIKEVSLLYNLPASTLRYYEAEGLLTQVSRNENGHRIYEEKHLSRLGTIRCFKNTGMSISTLKELFTYEENNLKDVNKLLSLLVNHEETLMETIQELQKDLDHIQRKVQYFEAIQFALEKNLEKPSWHEFKEKKDTDLIVSFSSLI